LGLFLIIGICISFDNFFEKIYSKINIRLVLYAELLIIYCLFWLKNKHNLPRNNKNTVGIIICIKTENDKQKIRLKNDLVKRLVELIKGNQLDSKINIILLNNHQAEKIGKILEKYTIANDKIKRGELDKIPKEIKDWQKLQKVIRGHFYIWGDIKERQDIDNKYFLDLEALTVHIPVNFNISQKIKEEFLNAWYKKVYFQEKLEFKGFIITADLIYIAVKYITGISALISRDPFLALELHEKLVIDLEKFQPKPPNIIIIQRKLTELMAEECLIISRLFFNDTEPNLTESKKYLDKSFKILPNHYGGYLFKAILEFLVENDAKKSLATINVAKYYSNNDNICLYNEGFLLMYLEEFEKAIYVYKKIIKGKYKGELLTVEEVCNFNINYLKTNPKNIQSLFIIGLLKYKKQFNYPEALLYFENFLEQAKNQGKYNILIQEVNKYKKELEDKMQLELKN